MKQRIIFLTMLVSMLGAFVFANESDSNLENNTLVDNFSNIDIDQNPYFEIINNETIFMEKHNIKQGISQKAKDKQNKLKGKNLHLILQFNKNPSKTEIQELERNGIKLLNYVSTNTYYVTFSNNFENLFNETELGLKLKSIHIDDKYLIRGIDVLDEKEKKSNLLQKNQIGDWSKAEDGRVYLTIKFYDDVNLKDARKILSKYNVEVLTEWETINSLNVLVDESNIDKISKLDEVMSLQEKYPEPRNELEYTKGVVEVNYVHSNLNLLGEGITIFQYEINVPDNNHSDLKGRVSWFGDTIDPTGHATGVAGILIGNGTLNSNRVGIAPKAQIRADERDEGFDYNNTGGILGIPYDYGYVINIEDVDLGTNSWGYGILSKINSTNKEQLCSYYGDYENNAELFDNIVHGDLTYLGFSVKPIPIIFSVGNERDGNNNPCNATNNPNYPYNTINPPKAGKNIIAVGSIDWWNDDAISYFSSYGPTDDGRIKPELVAPGNGVITTSLNNDYSSVIGTSFSAPHVSGTIALMLEQWNKSGYQNDPLPSTIKALLLDSTTDLKNDGSGEQTIDGPDYINGFGLLNAKGAIDRIINQTFLEANLSDENEVDTYAINITTQNSIKITLAWDDVPGQNLINDLDLKLISPNGTTYYPWTLNPNIPNQTAIRTQEDHLNNIEQVYINSTEIQQGEWLILITSDQLPYEQKYSLVSENKISPTPQKLQSDSNLFAYYKLDENANDFSQNSNHATPLNLGYNSSPHNKTALFNGSNSKIETPNYNLDNLTISFWYKKNSAQESALISQTATNQNSDFLVLFTLQDGRLFLELDYLGTSNRISLTTLQTLPLNQWNHITITHKKAEKLKLYINGKLINETTALNYSLPSQNVQTRIGNLVNWYYNTEQSYFSGSIDEVGIWKKVLNQNEILKLYSSGINLTTTPNTSTNLDLDNGLILHLPLNNNLLDSSPMKNNGTGNSLTYNSSCKFLGCYYFNGINSSIQLGNLDISKNFTISMWIKKSENDYRSLFSQSTAGTGVSDFYALTLLYNGQIDSEIDYESATQRKEIYGGTTNLNTWHNILLTHEKLGYMRLYIDGIQITNIQTPNNNIKITGVTTKIGSIMNWYNGLEQHFYKGYIDEIKVWNRSLNASEILNISSS